MARYDVTSGATSTGIILNFDSMYVSSGGTAVDITVNPNGYLYVYSGGTATNIVWTPCEGHVYVYGGGYATFASKYSGVYFGSGNKLLSSAAAMDGKTLDPGYEMYVMKDGTATNATVNENGYLLVSSGGTAANATVNSGGDLDVHSGGTANNTTVM